MRNRHVTKRKEKRKKKVILAEMVASQNLPAERNYHMVMRLLSSHLPILATNDDKKLARLTKSACIS
jgi:hypothetical protein